MQTCRNPAGQLWMLCADFFRWLFLSICGVWRGSPLLLGLHKLSELAEHIASWIMAYVPYILVIGAMTWELVGFSFSPHPSHVFHCPVAILRHFHTALAKHKHTKCWDIPLTPFLPTIHTTDSRSMFFFLQWLVSESVGDLCWLPGSLLKCPSVTIRTIGLSQINSRLYPHGTVYATHGGGRNQFIYRDSHLQDLFLLAI